MKPRNDKVKSGITHDEIIQWGGQEVFNQALALCNSGDVSDVKYDDDTLVISGKILQPSGYQMPVSLKLKPNGRIDSKCPCPTNQRFGKVCAHVVAIGTRRTWRASSSAQAWESLTPATTVYSKVMMRLVAAV